MGQAGIQEQFQAIQEFMDRGENTRALDEVRRLLGAGGDVAEVRFNCAGVLIDTGEQLRNVPAVRDGIAIYESLNLNPSGRDANLARGYLVLADLELGEGASYWDNAENTTFQKGKRLALDLVTRDGIALTPACWLMAGHALSKVGRDIEALYAYDGAVRAAPGHPLAIGAKANTLIHLAPLLGPNGRRAVREAARMLQRVVDHPDLHRLGFPAARAHFQVSLGNALRVLGGAPSESGQDPVIAPEPETIPSYLSDFLTYCRRWRLFLNDHLHDERVLPALGDTVFLVTMTAEGKEDRFPRLATLFNQIKEDFATARYLLFRALHSDELQKSAGLMTGYADLQDGSFFWLDNGLLKTAFGLAYNILDKIAYFINEYFNLGHEVSEVTFKRFWQEKHGGRTAAAGRKTRRTTQRLLHARLRQSSNPGVVALVDLSRDLTTARFRRLGAIRHAQTHRCLVLVRRDTTYAVQIPGVEAVRRSELELEAVRLLRTVKSAIFSLAAAVDIEEQLEVGPGPSMISRRRVPVQAQGEEPERTYSGM